MSNDKLRMYVIPVFMGLVWVLVAVDKFKIPIGYGPLVAI